MSISRLRLEGSCLKIYLECKQPKKNVWRLVLCLQRFRLKIFPHVILDVSQSIFCVRKQLGIMNILGRGCSSVEI